MPRFLLLPDDEREFAEWLADAHGLNVLRSDLLGDDGRPVCVSLDSLPSDLPGTPVVRHTEPAELLFWHPSRAVNSLEPWGGDSALAKVSQWLTADAAQARGVFTDRLFDVERSEVIRLRRSRWTVDGLLQVAAVRASARPANAVPLRVAEILRTAESWLSLAAEERHGPTSCWCGRTM